MAIDPMREPAGITITGSQINSTQFTKWTMALFGSWQLANDGARTNGGGIVGDVTLTNQAAAMAKTFDASEAGGTLGNIAVAGARAGYTSNFQLFPDAPADTDYAAFGGAVPFCELAFNLSATAAVYDEATVLVWEYTTAVDTWATLTVVTDSTDTDDQSGGRSFQQDGALSFIPPTNWASVALDGQTAYWIRAIIQTAKGDNMTTVPLLDSVEHDLVTPNGGFTCPHDGTITRVRVIDGATVLHSGSEVHFIVMDFTTGGVVLDDATSLTWRTSRRQDDFPNAGLLNDLAVNAGDELGALVTQEDSGNNDPTNCALELQVTRT